MSDVADGEVAPGYEPVRQVFAGLHARGWDIGSAFAAFVGGERVVHLHRGVRDPQRGLPYDGGTIQLVASASKFAESLCVALAVDRGLLSYDDRIATLWPDFAAGDEAKAAVTVRQLMMHHAGLPSFDRKVTERELLDLDERGRFLARQRQAAELFRPEPGDGDWRRADPAPPQAYHAVSRGLYASEVVRRVDPRGRALGRFLDEEIAGPLGLRFWIGLPEGEEGHVSPTHASAAAMMALLGLGGAPPLDADDPRYQLHGYELEFLRRFITRPDSLARRALDCLDFPGIAPQELGNHRRLRACELPSSNGVGSAESLARLAALAAGGGALGTTRIFTRPETLAEACACAGRYDVDAFLLAPVAFTQGGFARFAGDDAAGTVSYGWGGAGGQMVRFVPELGLGCAYVTNTLGARMAMNDPRPLSLLRAAVECARR